MTTVRMATRGVTATRSMTILVGAVVVVVLVVVGWRLSRPLRYGQVDPPKVDLTDVEPAVVKRIRVLTASLEDTPYSAEAWGDLGLVLDVHDLTAPAIECYERAAALDTKDFRWPHFAGYCRQGGDEEGALIDFARSVELRPEYAPGQVMLGRAYVLANDAERARTHFRRALELDPTIVRAHVGLGEVGLVSNKPDDAIGHLENAVALGANSGEVYGLLAEAHRSLGDDETADRYALAARDRVFVEPIPNPVRSRARQSAAVSLMWRRRFAEHEVNAGRLDAAVAIWNVAARDDPTASEPHGQIAIIEASRGRPEAAIAAFRRALELDPLDHEARNSLGSILVTDGKEEEGLELLRMSCRFLPDAADAHFNLAMALRSVGRDAEAIKALEHAVLVNEEFVRAHFELGQLLVRAERIEDAIEPFRRVTELDPSRFSGHSNLARALNEVGRHAEVIAALEAGRAHVADEKAIVTLLGWRLATCPDPQLRNGRAALDLIVPLVDASTGDPLLFDTLAAAYAADGDFVQAKQYVDRAIGLLVGIRDSGGAVSEELIEAVKGRRDLYDRDQPYVE